MKCVFTICSGLPGERNLEQVDEEKEGKGNPFFTPLSILAVVYTCIEVASLSSFTPGRVEFPWLDVANVKIMLFQVSYFLKNKTFRLEYV